MKKCPYCFEELPGVVPRCIHCNEFIIDPIVEVDYHSFQKKNCIFCGKKIFSEARICKYCHKWNDEIDRAAGDFDNV